MADFMKNCRLHPVKGYRKMDVRQKLELKSVLVLLCALLTMYLMANVMENGGSQPSSYPGQESEAPVLSSAGTPAPAARQSAAQGIIRFHVIANSDSDADQALKLEVRNQVLSQIQIELADQFAREISASGQEKLSEDQRLELTRSWLQEHLPQIKEWAEEAIAAEGFSYPIDAGLGIIWIPDRDYDGIYFPAGSYEALTLTIGQGAGQNWWCVIYPPLCLIDSSEALREELGEARFQAWLESLGGDRIVLRSKIAELMKAQKK